MARVSAFLTLLALVASTTALPLDPRQTTCVSGLYIISGRGSDEDPGEGKVAQVSSLIKAAVPDSTSVGVDYPAAIISDDSVYPASVAVGVDDTLDKIHTYVDTCGSSSRIVLLGYSQGGNVMTSVLAGGIENPTPLEPEYAQFITGVAVMGDPTHTAGQSYNGGNATNGGIFTRLGPSLAKLNTYAGILRSYCTANDPICADGFDLDVHFNEVPTHAQEASDFIVALATT